MKRIFIILTVLMVEMISLAQTVQQADSLHQRGRELLNEGKIAEGRECTRQAMEMRKALLGEVSEDYITSLNNYALTYGMEKDYRKAVELQEQVMTLCEKLKAPHKNLGMYTTNMGRYYYFSGDKKRAAQVWEQAIPLVEKYGENYEYLLNSLAFAYDEQGDFQNLDRIMGLMDEHNVHELSKPCDEPKCMLDRAMFYQLKGDNANAKECYQKVLEMEMDNEMKIKVFEAYAQYLAEITNDGEQGAEYQQKAATMRKQLNGENTDYAHSVYLVGFYYSRTMTNDGWEKAIECYDKALPIYQKSDDRQKVAKCHKMKGNALSALGDYERAKLCYLDALAYYEAYDRENTEYPKMIERVASAEKFNKEYEASIAHYRQALELYDQRGMIEEYADAENGLKLCYAYAGKNMSEATDGKNDDAIKTVRTEKLNRLIAETKGNLELTRKYSGKLATAQSLGTIAGCYVQKEEYKDAIGYYGQYMETIREAIRDEFRMQSETERMKTWEQETSNIKDLQELLVELPEAQKELAGDVASLAYDTELLSKGILLNSSVEFEKMLNDKGDTQLACIYQQIKDNRTEIERLRKEANSENDLEKILTLSQEVQRLQTELNKGCREMADFTQYISYNWKDVQSALSEHDVSIEFASVNMGFGDTGSHMFAVVLTKNMQRPVAIPLWDDDNLWACSKTEFYRFFEKSLIDAMVFKTSNHEIVRQFKEKLSGSDIPYKPELALYLNRLEHKEDSLINIISDAIGTIKYPDLLQQDDVLYSTPWGGEIVWNPLSQYLEGKHRVFFSADGLLNHIAIEYLPYHDKPFSEQFEVYRLSSTKELCYRREKVSPLRAALFGDINYNNEATKPVDPQHPQASLRGAADAGGFADLSHTRREVDGIRNILEGKGLIKIEQFHNTEASRSAFLGLTDHKVNLLHIATHGIYKDLKQTDAESMQNSLLAFAGANIDDSALVTAADISQMNLRQCDLAVLSACETGLGKLGSDGVFGLQRGFKNAGVRTLLMSLKNVPDGPTADLMIMFYRHLMDGSTKREALIKAQQDIRKKGFNDPKYWATFILLDAID